MKDIQKILEELNSFCNSNYIIISQFQNSIACFEKHVAPTFGAICFPKPASTGLNCQFVSSAAVWCTRLVLSRSTVCFLDGRCFEEACFYLKLSSDGEIYSFFCPTAENVSESPARLVLFSTLPVDCRISSSCLHSYGHPPKVDCTRVHLGCPWEIL